MPRKVSSSRPKSPELAPIARRIHSRVLHHRSQAPASGLRLEARAANQPDAQPIAHARTRLDGSFVAIWHARSSAVTSATDLTSAQGVFTMSLPVPSVDVAASAEQPSVDVTIVAPTG